MGQTPLAQHQLHLRRLPNSPSTDHRPRGRILWFVRRPPLGAGRAGMSRSWGGVRGLGGHVRVGGGLRLVLVGCGGLVLQLCLGDVLRWPLRRRVDLGGGHVEQDPLECCRNSGDPPALEDALAVIGEVGHALLLLECCAPASSFSCAAQDVHTCRARGLSSSICVRRWNSSRLRSRRLLPSS